MIGIYDMFISLPQLHNRLSIETRVVILNDYFYNNLSQYLTMCSTKNVLLKL